MTDISTAEAVPVGELDESAIKAGVNDATRESAAHAEGTKERAVAQIQLETFKAMGKAIGLSL